MEKLLNSLSLYTLLCKISGEQIPMLDIYEKIASALLIPEGHLCFRASLVWAGQSNERDIIFSSSS